MNKHTRRQFLKGLGGFTIAIPFLPSLEAFAQAGPPKLRFISMGASLGVYRQQWQPIVNATQELGGGAFGFDLTDIAGDLSPVFNNSNFGNLKSKILFMRGLDQCFNPDHNSGILSAAPGGNTIDNVLGLSKKIYDKTPALRSLVINPHPLGIQGSSYSAITNGDRFERKKGIGSAQTAFDLAIKGQSGPPVTSTTEPTTTDLQKVVDRVYEDYKAVSNNRRIGSEDKARLEDHMSYLSQIENDLSQSPLVQACANPTLVKTSTTSTSDWEAAIKNHIDIAVAALACGSTRLVSFSFPRTYYDKLTGGYHNTVSHSATNITGFNNVHIPFAKHIAYFIRSLDAIKETDGRSLLYHSILLNNNTLTYGYRHAICDMAVFLAGNAGGAIDTGRLIDYRQRPFTTPKDAKGQNIGRPYNQLMVTILQLMGLGPADYESADAAGFGVYSGRPGVNAKHAPFLTDTVKRSKLPGLKR